MNIQLNSGNSLIQQSLNPVPKADSVVLVSKNVLTAQHIAELAWMSLH